MLAGICNPCRFQDKRMMCLTCERNNRTFAWHSTIYPDLCLALCRAHKHFFRKLLLLMKAEIKYRRIIKLIRQLPASQRARLKAELEIPVIGIADFRQMLLEAPVMTDDQHRTFLESRKRFARWRRK